VVVEGFAHPDDRGVQSHEEFSREILRRVISDMEKAGVTPYLAVPDGTAGGATTLLAFMRGQEALHKGGAKPAQFKADETIRLPEAPLVIDQMVQNWTTGADIPIDGGINQF